MIVFAVIAAVSLLLVFALSHPDREERTDPACECVPFELASEGAGAEPKKKTPIERYYPDANGDIITFAPDGTFIRTAG